MLNPFSCKNDVMPKVDFQKAKNKIKSSPFTFDKFIIHILQKNVQTGPWDFIFGPFRC